MMTRKIFAIFCIVSMVVTTAGARVHCRQDGVGGSKCVGYNDNGEYVSLRSRTNSLGLTTTQGRIGDRAVNTRSRVGMVNNKNKMPKGTKNMRIHPNANSANTKTGRTNNKRNVRYNAN